MSLCHLFVECEVAYLCNFRWHSSLKKTLTAPNSSSLFFPVLIGDVYIASLQLNSKLVLNYYIQKTLHQRQLLENGSNTLIYQTTVRRFWQKIKDKMSISFLQTPIMTWEENLPKITRFQIWQIILQII